MLKRLLVIPLALVLLSCSEDRPGSAAVYEEIETSTDCAFLQDTFDRNMDAWDARPFGDPLKDVVGSYADAALDRMEDIDCG